VSSVIHPAGSECGWWPPGAGEPGQNWTFEPADVVVEYDGSALTLLVSTPDGPRCLASVPPEALVQVFAAYATEEGAVFEPEPT
jgi:hypothetical protein